MFLLIFIQKIKKKYFKVRISVMLFPLLLKIKFNYFFNLTNSFINIFNLINIINKVYLFDLYCNIILMVIYIYYNKL